MTVDVDEILRAHAADAARAEPAPDDWPRLVARLADPEDGEGPVVPIVLPGRRRGRRLLVAAAVLAVLGLAALVVATRPEGDDVRSGPAATETGGTPIDPPGVTVAEVPGPQPDRVVATVDLTGDGRLDLVRLEGLGERVEHADGSVGLEDLDATVLVDGRDVVPAQLEVVDVGPDGIAYYGVCCDEPGGEVRAVDVATGEDGGVVAAGHAPAASPDGSTLAVASQDGIALVDLATGTATAIGPYPAGRVVRLAWSPDGTRLALVHASPLRPSVRLIQVAEVGGVLPDDVVWTSLLLDEAPPVVDAAFLADGRLVVATTATDGVPGIAGGGLGIVDLDGRYQWRIGGVHIGAIDATFDGRWLVGTSSSPLSTAIRAFSGDDLQDSGTIGQLDLGVRAAAW